MSAYHRALRNDGGTRMNAGGSLSGPRIAVAAVALAVVATACGPSAVPTSTAAAAASFGLPSFALPSFVGDEELEAMFPAAIAGQTLTVTSLNGAEYLARGGGTQVQPVLDALHKTPDDLSVAFAGVPNLVILAFRVKGSSAADILPALEAVYGQQLNATATPLAISGKTVVRFTAATGEITYVYPVGDVVFTVGGAGLTDAQLSEVFSALP